MSAGPRVGSWILKCLLILPPLAPKDLPDFWSTGEVLDLSVLAQVMTLSDSFLWLHLGGWGSPEPHHAKEQTRVPQRAQDWGSGTW